MDRKMSEKEINRFMKLAGLIKETWHPDDPSSVDIDDISDEDPEDFDDVSESDTANTQWYEDFEAGLRNMLNNNHISSYEYKEYMKALDHVDPMDNYGEMTGHDAAKEFVDDLRTKNQMDADDEQWRQEHGGYDMGGDDFNDGEFWESEVKRFKEIAGVSQPSDGPEDDDEDEREARAKKAEMDDEEAENAERDLDEDAYDESGDTDAMGDIN
jgi:hypothetical protein